MSICAVKFAARRQHGCDDVRPTLHVGQPAQDSPRRKDQIERARRYTRRLVYSSLNEVSLQPGFLGKAARDLQRYTGEIEPRRNSAESRQTERVQPDMALQMEDALAADVAELGRFDPVER